MVVHAPVTSSYYYISLFLSVTLLLIVLTQCVFVSQWERFWMVIAAWRFLSVPVCTWDDISLQDPQYLRTATPGEGATCMQ